MQNIGICSNKMIMQRNYNVDLGCVTVDKILSLINIHLFNLHYICFFYLLIFLNFISNKYMFIEHEGIASFMSKNTYKFTSSRSLELSPARFKTEYCSLNLTTNI